MTRLGKAIFENMSKLFKTVDKFCPFYKITGRGTMAHAQIMFS